MLWRTLLIKISTAESCCPDLDWTTTWQCFRQLVQQSISVFSDRSSTAPKWPPCTEYHSWSHGTLSQSWLMRGQLWHCSLPFYLQAAPHLPLELLEPGKMGSAVMSSQLSTAGGHERQQRQEKEFLFYLSQPWKWAGAALGDFSCRAQGSVFICITAENKMLFKEGVVLMNCRQSSSKYYKNV